MAYDISISLEWCERWRLCIHIVVDGITREVCSLFTKEEDVWEGIEAISQSKCVFLSLSTRVRCEYWIVVRCAPLGVRNIVASLSCAVHVSHVVLTLSSALCNMSHPLTWYSKTNRIRSLDIHSSLNHVTYEYIRGRIKPRNWRGTIFEQCYLPSLFLWPMFYDVS